MPLRRTAEAHQPEAGNRLLQMGKQYGSRPPAGPRRRSRAADMTKRWAGPLKPVRSWQGGKFHLAPWLAERLPYRRAYGEPFAGMAAVLLQRRPSPAEWINDLDGNVSAFWFTATDRDRAAWLEDRVSRSPLASRPWFERAQKQLADPTLPERERAFWWLTTLRSTFASSGLKTGRVRVVRAAPAVKRWSRVPAAVRCHPPGP